MVDRICSHCDGVIGSDFVVLSTVKRGKTVKECFYCFPDCWLAYFNGLVDKKLNVMKDKLISGVKDTVGDVGVSDVIKGLVNVGKMFKGKD